MVYCVSYTHSYIVSIKKDTPWKEHQKEDHEPLIEPWEKIVENGESLVMKLAHSFGVVDIRARKKG